MTLSPALVGTLRTFNQMDPVARSGLLPVRDGTAFEKEVRRIPTPPARLASARASNNQKVGSSVTEVLSAGSEVTVPGHSAQPVRPITHGQETLHDWESPASAAGDTIEKSKLDPYIFSPPNTPGLDLG